MTWLYTSRLTDGARVSGTLRQLASRDTGLMPDRDPPVPQIVRVVVRDAGDLAGAGIVWYAVASVIPLNTRVSGARSSRGQVPSIASISHSGGWTHRAWSRFVADLGSRSRSPARSTSPQVR